MSLGDEGQIPPVSREHQRWLSKQPESWQGGDASFGCCAIPKSKTLPKPHMRSARLPSRYPAFSALCPRRHFPPSASTLCVWGCSSYFLWSSITELRGHRTHSLVVVCLPLLLRLLGSTSNVSNLLSKTLTHSSTRSGVVRSRTATSFDQLDMRPVLPWSTERAT